MSSIDAEREKVRTKPVDSTAQHNSTTSTFLFSKVMNFDIILCAPPFTVVVIVAWYVTCWRPLEWPKDISQCCLSHQKGRVVALLFDFQTGPDDDTQYIGKIVRKSFFLLFFRPSQQSLNLLDQWRYLWPSSVRWCGTLSIVEWTLIASTNCDEWTRKPTWEWNRYEDAIERKSTHNHTTEDDDDFAVSEYIQVHDVAPLSLPGDD